MDKMLAGKRIIVTGAARGIGHQMVECFAQYGASICAITRNENLDFEHWIQSLSKDNNVIIDNYWFDMNDYERMQVVIKEIGENGEVDGLVCNAGIPHNGMLQMTSIDKMREVMEVNFFSQMRLCQLVSRKMIRHKSGSIVLIGSVGGIDARSGYIAYGASKAALMWAGKAMAQELGEYSIRVNCVAPALTDTDQLSVRSEQSIEQNVAKSAIKRLATPKEIAETVAFLLSDRSSFTTGQILRVDGGK